MKIVNFTKFVSPVGRCSFPSVFKHAVFKNKSTGKYEITILLPKIVDGQPNPDVADMQAAANTAASEKFNGKIPRDLKHTWLGDGDKKEYEGYEGHWFIKAKSNRLPTVIDQSKRAIFPPKPAIPPMTDSAGNVLVDPATGQLSVYKPEQPGQGEYQKMQVGGHYIRLSMGFWVNVHEEGGKQVLMNLFGVQLVRDGVPFSSVSEDATDDFDTIAGDFGDDEF